MKFQKFFLIILLVFSSFAAIFFFNTKTQAATKSVLAAETLCRSGAMGKDYGCLAGYIKYTSGGRQVSTGYTCDQCTLNGSCYECSKPDPVEEPEPEREGEFCRSSAAGKDYHCANGNLVYTASGRQIGTSFKCDQCTLSGNCYQCTTTTSSTGEIVYDTCTDPPSEHYSCKSACGDDEERTGDQYY